MKIHSYKLSQKFQGGVQPLKIIRQYMPSMTAISIDIFPIPVLIFAIPMIKHTQLMNKTTACKIINAPTPCRSALDNIFTPLSLCHYDYQVYDRLLSMDL